MVVADSEAIVPFTLPMFQSIRPYLCHLTDQCHIDRIRRTERLFSASYLLQAETDDPEELDEKDEPE